MISHITTLKNLDIYSKYKYSAICLQYLSCYVIKSH